MTDYKPSGLNLLALIGVIAFASWFLLRQLFVHPDYQQAPINFKALMHKQTMTGALNNNVNSAKVTCSPKCSFELSGRIIPARLASDAAGQLLQLNLHFVDEERGLIGYDNASENSPEFYVINFDKELVQAIQLDLNHTRRLVFTGYYPDSGQIGFRSSDDSDWLYSAFSPDLIRL